MRDHDIREALRATVEAQHAADPSTRVIEELGLQQGVVRVDVAVVNGLLHGYEIKSAVDTLKRLPRQAEVYSAVLDRASIVTALIHFERILEIVPEWWEVLVVTSEQGHIRFDCTRVGSANPSIDSRALVELLWHQETLCLLDSYGAAKGLASKPRRAAWDRACEVVPLEEIRHTVRETLKARAERRSGRLPG